MQSDNREKSEHVSEVIEKESVANGNGIVIKQLESSQNEAISQSKYSNADMIVILRSIYKYMYIIYLLLV